MSSLPRDVVRWLGSLDLPFQVRAPKRDCCNGYIIAEICARSWPGVDLHRFSNGSSAAVRRDNWATLQSLFARNGAPIEAATVEAIIGCDSNAARDLVVALYSMFKPGAKSAAAMERVAPLEAEPVAAVPKFVKTSDRGPASEQRQLGGGGDGALAQHLVEESLRQRRAADTKAASDKARQHRDAAAAALDIAAAPPPPPPGGRRSVVAATAAAIRDPSAAAGGGGGGAGEAAAAVQFSGVSVRQLNTAALARLGGLAARPGPPGGAAGGGGGGGAAGEGALLELSAAVEAALARLGVVWPLGPGTTALQYFARHHTAQPEAIRAAFWKALRAQTGAAAAALVRRPGDCGPFAAAFLPGVDPAAAQRRLGRAPPPFTGADAAHGAALVRDVFLGFSARRPALAAAVLQRHVAPLTAAALGAAALHSNDDDDSAGAAGAGSDPTATADSALDARSLVLDAIVALAGVSTADALATRDPSTDRSAALDGDRCAAAVAAVYDAVVASAAGRGGSSARAAFLAAAAGIVERVRLASIAGRAARDPPAPPADECGVAAAAAAAPSAAAVPAALAASAHYHAVAGLHAASPDVRAAAATVLLPLVRGGHALLCAPLALAFVDAAFPAAPATSAVFAHAADAAPVAAAVLCAMVTALAVADPRRGLSSDSSHQPLLNGGGGGVDGGGDVGGGGGGGDGGGGGAAAAWRAPFEGRLVALLRPPAFAALPPRVRLALVSAAGEALGSFSPSLSSSSSTSSPSPAAAAAAAGSAPALLFVAALAELPALSQDVLFAPSPAAAPDLSLLRREGVLRSALWSPLDCAAAADRWALLPFVAAAAAPLAAAPLVAAARRRPSAGAPAPAPADADDGGGGGAPAADDAAHRAAFLIAAVIAARELPLCRCPAEEAGWWGVAAAPLGPSLATACRFLQAELSTPPDVRAARPPVDASAHARMVATSHRCRAIAAVLYAALSHEPHAEPTAAAVLESLRPVLAGAIAGTDPGAGGDVDTRVDTWIVEVVGGLQCTAGQPSDDPSADPVV